MRMKTKYIPIIPTAMIPIVLNPPPGMFEASCEDEIVDLALIGVLLLDGVLVKLSCGVVDGVGIDSVSDGVGVDSTVGVVVGSDSRGGWMMIS
jgi:hypothetical protein